MRELETMQAESLFCVLALSIGYSIGGFVGTMLGMIGAFVVGMLLVRPRQILLQAARDRQRKQDQILRMSVARQIEEENARAAAFWDNLYRMRTSLRTLEQAPPRRPRKFTVVEDPDRTWFSEDQDEQAS